MAFTTIPSALINVGKAIKKEIFSYVKDNFDDHETRINSLEGGANRVEVFNNTVLLGSISSTYTGIVFYEAQTAFTLTGAKVSIFETGSISSGTLEIDFKKNSSPDDTGMASIFTTKPSIDFTTASDYEESSNQVLDGTKTSISIGDFIRFDITSLPVGLGKLRIVLYGEVS